MKPTSIWRAVAILAVFLLCAIVCWQSFLRPQSADPDRTVRYCLARIEQGDINGQFILNGMPPKIVVPRLAAELAREESHLDRFWWRLWPKLPRRLARLLPPPVNREQWRLTCARELGLLGPTAKEAVPVLAVVLQASTTAWPLRVKIAQALGNIGPAATSAAPALVRALTDPHFWVRREAALALAHIGPPQPEALAVLPGLVEEPNQFVQVAAAIALWRLSPDDRAAKQYLTATLLDGAHPQSRGDAICLLAGFGEAAAPFAWALQETVWEQDPQLAPFAAHLLERIQAYQPFPILEP